MAEDSSLWDAATSKDRSAFRAQLGKRLGSMNDMDLSKPSQPVDTSRHVGFQYNSANADHKNLVTHLLNDGLAGSLTVHEGGKVSMHQALVDPNIPDRTAKLWKAAMDSAGADTFGGKVKPSTAPSVQRKPEGKKVSVASRPEMEGVFGNRMSRIDPELAAKAAAEKAKAEEAEKKARLAERKRRLRED